MVFRSWCERTAIVANAHARQVAIVGYNPNHYGVSEHGLALWRADQALLQEQLERWARRATASERRVAVVLEPAAVHSVHLKPEGGELASAAARAKVEAPLRCRCGARVHLLHFAGGVRGRPLLLAEAPHGRTRPRRRTRVRASTYLFFISVVLVR